ncbi:MAG TPA: class I adenylate-forming enzyme family protein [Amycolatopsis sp.]|nr:class I adenylate-forming enzyme family protein [Amycolatopsis sp.]
MTAPVLDTGADRTPWRLATHWAGARPDAPAVVDVPDPAQPRPATTSWERLVADTADLRRRLAAHGVTDQRTAVLALPNSPLTIALWLAIIANNATVQAIDVDSGLLAFERALQATTPAVVLACPDNAQRAAAAIRSTGSKARLIVPEDFTLTGGYGGIDGLAALGAEPGEAQPESVAGLLPTSGTSGAPKLVELTNHCYVSGAERLARNSGYLSTDRHYLCSPFFHTNGQIYLCMPAFVTGGSIATTRRFSATHYFSVAAGAGVTVSSMVAPPMRLALHRAVAAGRPVPAGSFRLIQYGMTLSAADWRDWDRLVPGIEMRQIYGQTESVTGVLGGSPWETDDRQTIGRPFVGVPAVRLVGDDGRDVADGTPGELWVAGTPGTTLMRGYLDAPEATAAALVDGKWLHTGDIMVRHPGGRFEFRGRRMHIIRRGGENLSTYALELDLQTCPLIEDAAVTAKDDPKLDALVVAHVIPAKGFTEDAFLAWCREKLGRRSVPDVVRTHTGFPRTGSGRVITRELG